MVYIGEKMHVFTTTWSRREHASYMSTHTARTKTFGPFASDGFVMFEDERVRAEKDVGEEQSISQSHENARPRLWPIAGRLGNDCDAR